MENYRDTYLVYLTTGCPTLNADSWARILPIFEKTNWDEPTSAIDLNNCAVLALIEAEQCEDLSLRKIYLEMAVDALKKGFSLQGHPLCAAHLALVIAMTGNMEQARDIAYTTFINAVNPTYISLENPSLGLVYIYSSHPKLRTHNYHKLNQILKAKNSNWQALVVLSEVLCHAELGFYSTEGQRLLYLASQFLQPSSNLYLKLGISHFIKDEFEGILYFHKAREIEPDSAHILQAIYLAYQDLGQTEVANFWLEMGRNRRQPTSDFREWQWTELALNSPFTYLPFENSILVAVEPSFRSIVTSVLLAEGDWFEKEMEFWRNSIKPGMTVIDVGANIGVYTFSAAQRVGPQGRVIAIEPFSCCIHCLQETIKINQLNQVKICAGAASDNNGTALLSLSNASELNEIVTHEQAERMKLESLETVRCFTLDSLIEKENLTQVNFLKIDAEGHELSVLVGSERILSEFAPVILYENRAGSQGSNQPVADYLIERGYKLFWYQPYLQDLVPIDRINEDGHNPLNLIALPIN
ncbi:FkbM family methyltransferase [Oscillatoria acuminata]|uniref:Methyltransferase, FkbM family n=1 Tax=Oscillatoria acuminata PCC 6304 TaxID=56110 RepID=K9TDH0_9CYAN|nr:FkbM family methyltransferase [Oscillatoria acuminata]AFY80054.1 methyltransferase, FkbM family [Oscillatoria acuminata PCC 6304]